VGSRRALQVTLLEAVRLYGKERPAIENKAKHVLGPRISQPWIVLQGRQLGERVGDEDSDVFPSIVSLDDLLQVV